jgi:hypothetical protein
VQVPSVCTYGEADDPQRERRKFKVFLQPTQHFGVLTPLLCMKANQHPQSTAIGLFGANAGLAADGDTGGLAITPAGQESAARVHADSGRGPEERRDAIHAAAPGPPGAVRPTAWRASTWLLIGWTLTVGLWIVAEISRLDACPYYAEHNAGCSTALGPLVSDRASIEALVAVWLAGVAALLLLVRRDRRSTRTATAADPRRSRWLVLTTASLAGVLAGAHFLLLAPMISNPVCATAVHVNQFMAYPLNCDSSLFLQLAHHPAELLAKASSRPDSPAQQAVAASRLWMDHLRQSRPGYVALGAAVTKILGSPAARLGLDRAYAQTNSAYIPLILINLVIVVAAVVLLARLLRGFGAPATVVIALGSLLVLNDLMKAFFWTPHEQMFVLLTPLVTIAAGRWLILERPRWPWVSALGLSLGLGALIYANVLISMGVLTVILLARGRRGIGQSLMLWVTFAIAPLGWIWICRKISGIYYNNDVAHYREFVWLPQAFGQGWRVFSARLELASVSGLRELIGADGLALGVIAVFMTAAILAGVRLSAATRTDTATLTATALTIALSLVFGWGIGILATRVMFDAFPAFLVLAGWMATRFAVRSRATLLVASYGLAIIAVANALHEVLTHGPYS